MKSFYYLRLCFVCFLAFSCNESKKSAEDIDKQDDLEVEVFKTAKFLTLSDVHLDSSKTNVPYGSIHSTGRDIWERTINQINTVSNTIQPKFMVYVGDVPNYTEDIHGNISKVFKDLSALKGDYPILFLPGNNDTMNGDYNSFQNAPNPNGVSVFSLNNNTWPIINRNSTTTTVGTLDFNEEFGFYSVELTIDGERLQIIALNSVIFSRKYTAYDGVTRDTAAQRQFSWFENKLDSYATTDHVLVMMHIPPGRDGHGTYGANMWDERLYVKNKNDKSKKVQNAFLDVLKNNKPKLRGILTSHTHLDGLRRLYASDRYGGNMITVSISTPGISVYHNNNPGFKSFTFNSSNFDLTDFATYYAEPTDSLPTSSYKDRDFKYISKPYSFKNTYKITDEKMSIFSAIEQLKHRHIINGYMKDILYVRSKDTSAAGRFHYDHALDVLYQ
ncbi:metallophosphoesterase [Psychroserpens sp. SPM9]|uniref:metallophosphoesterase n=1 Tax=Psychroserpens sp. SPM9 TaxID=2975598 RepID=UPI0021A7B4E3|nr:metallophosphoesterase [Psychroserpens sp. SPM9]MDG5491881.1 metallophosphoesterase [Psychroserpens sp. SPM9]